MNNHWAKPIIERLVTDGIIDGYKNNTFRPNDTISRAEFVKIVRNALDIKLSEHNRFQDTATHWARYEIASLVNHGAINPDDFPDNNFYPDRNITRAEMGKIIVKAGLKTNLHAFEGKATAFEDDNVIDNEDKKYVIAAYEKDIIKGYPDNTFRPDDVATRAEASQMIINMFKAVEKEKGPLELELKEEVINRINERLAYRNTEINLPKGIKSVAIHNDPKTYDHLIENIEALKEYGFSTNKRKDWELIALDQFVSNREDWSATSYNLGVVKMKLPAYEKLTSIEYEGRTYNALYIDALIDNKFSAGLLVKDGEIIDMIAKTSEYYSLGAINYRNLAIADYLCFHKSAMDLFPSSMKFQHRGESILFVFDNPFKENPIET